MNSKKDLLSISKIKISSQSFLVSWQKKKREAWDKFEQRARRVEIVEVLVVQGMICGLSILKAIFGWIRRSNSQVSMLGKLDLRHHRIRGWELRLFCGPINHVGNGPSLVASQVIQYLASFNLSHVERFNFARDKWLGKNFPANKL